VDAEAIALARPRRGHFDLGTGYHGDLWLDLDALFLRPALLQPHVQWLAARLRGHQVDAVCGPMEGGAFLAQAIATVLGTAFLPAYRVPAARPGGLDGPGERGGPVAYRLAPVAGGISGWRVAIADDAVNAGTAIQACVDRLRRGGALPVAVGALLAVGPAHASVATTMALPFYPAGAIESQAWPAGRCPLCASGTPLTDPAGPAGPAERGQHR
jgi:orotate phosphoribosyltransferase